jgi:hypothetical protein
MMITTTSLGDAHSSMARKLFHDCSSVHTATRVRMLSPPTYLRDKVFCTGILKISVVTDKREYRIYRKFIGDRNKISEEI